MRLKKIAVFVMLSWISMGVFAEGERMVLDPASSEFGYQVGWEGIPFFTRFTQYSGELQMTSDGDPTKLEIRIRLSGLDSENEERDEGMLLPEWFWGGKHPLAVYRSDSIERLQGGQYRSNGTLRLRGVSKAVSVVFSWLPSVNDAKGSMAVMKGEVMVSRLDFGIGLGEWSTDEYVGLQVLTRFNLHWKASP